VIVREEEVLTRVRAIFDSSKTNRSVIANIVIGNGDDGAVVKLDEGLTILSTDMAVENIHFRRAWSSPQEIGRKITAANLADICAMGGWPEYLLVAVAFPKDYLNELEALARGIAEEAKKVGASVIGGDLSGASEIVISITAVGRTMRAITRSGAHVGDVVMISHLPGWSKVGLEILSRDLKHVSESSQRALMQHRAPQIDYRKYRQTYDALNSATDISDGLLIDAGHIARASGVALNLQSTLIEKVEGFAALYKLAQEFATGESSGMDFVLNGGEDHVLLVTTSTPEKCEGFFEIGRVEQGEGVLLDGKVVSGEAGYQHHW
jgi:thiamine-monophosphate kinase